MVWNAEICSVVFSTTLMLGMTARSSNCCQNYTYWTLLREGLACYIVPKNYFTTGCFCFWFQTIFPAPMFLVVVVVFQSEVLGAGATGDVFLEVTLFPG